MVKKAEEKNSPAGEEKEASQKVEAVEATPVVDIAASPVKAEPMTESRYEESGDKALVKSGILEVMPEGYGFLRAANGGDIYISASQIRRFDIRGGDEVTGGVRPPKENERYFGMLKVESVNGVDPEKA